jgi:hypothetical protein
MEAMTTPIQLDHYSRQPRIYSSIHRQTISQLAMKVKRMEAYSLPLNNGWLDSNSAKIQPMDQTSTRDEMRKGQKKGIIEALRTGSIIFLKRMSIYVRGHS